MAEFNTGKIKAGPSPFGLATGSQYRVLCADGKVRTATVTGEADTYFSLPARVSVNGKIVAGSISVNELNFGRPTWIFTASSRRAFVRERPAWGDWPMTNQNAGNNGN